jgi:predicted enzyme related to lactoylglutathione lyase
MKRMHIHVSIEDLSKSIDFYSKLFGCGPTKQKDD